MNFLRKTFVVPAQVGLLRPEFSLDAFGEGIDADDRAFVDTARDHLNLVVSLDMEGDERSIDDNDTGGQGDLGTQRGGGEVSDIHLDTDCSFVFLQQGREAFTCGPFEQPDEEGCTEHRRHAPAGKVDAMALLDRELELAGQADLGS